MLMLRMMNGRCDLDAGLEEMVYGRERLHFMYVTPFLFRDALFRGIRK